MPSHLTSCAKQIWEYERLYNDEAEPMLEAGDAELSEDSSIEDEDEE